MVLWSLSSHRYEMKVSKSVVVPDLGWQEVYVLFLRMSGTHTYMSTCSHSRYELLMKSKFEVDQLKE